MAEEPRKTSSRRAVFSYDQLKRQTIESGAPWTDIHIKDYQGIAQDTAFLADELDVAEGALNDRIDALDVRVAALEYKTFAIVQTTESIETLGFQIIVCKNTSAIDITLDPEAMLDDEVHIKRRDGVVNVIGTIDGFTNKRINVKYYSMHLVYDGEEWNEI